MIDKIYIPFTRVRLGRFSFLLVAIILTFSLRPFVEGYFRINPITDIFLSVVLLLAIHTVSEQRRSLFIALALALPSLLSKGVYYLVNNPLFLASAEVFGALLPPTSSSSFSPSSHASKR